MANKSLSIINADVKNTLRNLKFPDCAQEALKKIELICIAQNTNRTQSSQNIKQMEMAMEIIGEFIFCENVTKTYKKKVTNSVQSLSKIQELQLLEMLCNYMSNVGESEQVIKNAVFMFLFPHSHAHRSRILVKLVSMAISTNNHQILISTGILMQQIGCTTKFSTDIAEGLVNDYFILIPEALSKLEDLPIYAPLFTANLLTALSEMYTKQNINENLLKIITEWISKHTGLCYTALVTNLQSSLPNGAIPMPAITPFVGLFKWCILSPFYNNTKNATLINVDSGKSDNINSDNGNDNNEDNENDNNIIKKNNTQLLYSKLHFSLLTSLMQSNQYCELPTQRNIIHAESLCNIISYILIFIKENENNLNNNKSLLDDCIHRLAQCVQVALHTQSIYGNKQKLMTQLLLLPNNRVLSLVIEKNKI